MVTNLLIREAEQQDEEVFFKMICELENAILDHQNFIDVFRKNCAADNITYFIAELEGNAVGIISCHIQSLLHHAARVAEIQEMYVDPAFRSKAIGKALIAHVLHFAQGKGAVQIEVTSGNSREGAHRFYQREGFAKSHVKLIRYFTKK